ncbi:MAG TPA: ABC transporter permease [Bryobacteraceae bacterium]|jgi:predicted permease|nr:ABC transporter permease [Bryobacteraceae bacterium]
MSRGLQRLRLTLRSVFRRNRVDEELDEELQYHLERLIADGVNSGLTPEGARYGALRAMGGIMKSREECRDMRHVNFIDDLARDLRYAGRSLRRSPGFSALAALIMALGIGANTAVFSVVNAVLLKPLSYRDPDRIVSLTNPLTTGESHTALGARLVSIPNFQDWRDQSSSFEAMAYYQGREAPVMAGSTAEYAQVTGVSADFFRVFGVQPVVGRFFSAEDVKRGGGGALISYAYWQNHFGGDARVLGRTVRVYDLARPIVGVLPPGFHFPDKTDLWVPHGETDLMKSRLAQNDYAIALLKPGVSLEHAQTEMTVIARRLEQQYPDTNKGRTVTVTRVRDEMVGDVRLTLYLLLGAVGVVLLIACANTATLLLGKAMSRTREVAVRAALGASRRRIVRQLITESLLLALTAGAAGLLFANWGSRALVALAPADLPRLADTRIDSWVLAFTLGVSLATSLLFGLVPALWASKADLNGALKQAATRSVTGGGMVRVRGALVVAEIALAVVLLSGAGLLTRSFVALQKVALGFRPQNVLVMRATVPAPIPEANRFFNDVISQIGALPGVLAAGATMAPPGHVESSGGYFLDHMPAQPDWTTAPHVALNVVAPGTFAALGIPLTSGRDFNNGDTPDKPLVVVVNQALVRKSFAGESPLGRTIFCPFDTLKGMTIIGVVGDVRQSGPGSEPIPECYMAYRQHVYNGTALSIVVRTTGDPAALTQTLRGIARARLPDVPVKFTTMEAIVSDNVAAPRFRALLFGLFSALAACLAIAGVYGVMAYAVGQRSNEIGLRIALGATTGSVLRLIIGRGLALAALGLALGLTAAVAGTRLLTTMLFQVKPNDSLVYLAVAVVLSAVTLVAGFVPARRASKIDPLAALRQE